MARWPRPLAAALQRLRHFLLRRRGPEPSPIVLTQRRIYVLPTAGGTVFGTAVTMLLVGSVNYSLSLGYLLTFLLVGLGIVAIAHTFRNLYGLSIVAGRTEPGFAGERCGFTLVLHNARKEPRPALRLRIPRGEDTTVHLPAASALALTLHLPVQRRGWVRPGRMVVSTRHPLSLVRAWAYAVPDMRCLVYPEPERNAPPLPGTGGGAGNAQAAAHGQGREDFAGLRSFQPADSPRHVAWKAVARGAPPLTKQFDGTADDHIWLDWHALPTTLGVEQRLSRLTAWVLAAQSAGLAFGLRLPQREFAPAAGEVHVQTCLKALALHGIDGH